MCGILGIYNFDRTKNIKKEYLQDKLNVLYNRGPDDFGIYINGNIGLGFRRLSIIDLSFSGHQPMCNEDSSIWAVCNGEIYNYLELKEELMANGHTFKSSSDTEVILHAYEEFGENCVNKFNGMWAFAVWDNIKKVFFASRDRFGIKPFYYYSDKERFLCASEIKALLATDGVRVSENYRRTYEYIMYGRLDNSEETMFKGVFQLRPGHNLVLKDNKVITYRYWDLEDKVNNYDLIQDNEEKLYERFRELLFSSIKLHMRSDVEIWTLLSGGLDSSAIACIQKELKIRGKIGSPIKTISVVHESKDINEYEFVKELIDNVNITNIVVRCNEEDFIESLEKVVFIQDEPFPQMALFNHYFLMKEVASKNIKVVLSGEGSDECMSGYFPQLISYYLIDLLRSFRFLKLLKESRLCLKKYNTVFHPLPLLLMQMLKSFLPDKTDSLLKAAYLEKSMGLISRDFFSMDKEVTGFNHYKKNYSSLNNNLYRLLVNDSLPRILHMEDRNSMAFSIEQRVPFLDYRLVEFLFSLSNTQKVDNGTTKIILRNALKGILPEKIRTRITKLSFNAPEGKWLKSDRLWEYLKDINYECLLSTGIVDRASFNKEFTNFKKERSPYKFVLWRVVNYIIWKKVFCIS